MSPGFTRRHGGGQRLVVGDDFGLPDEKRRPRSDAERTLLAATLLPAELPPATLLRTLSQTTGSAGFVLPEPTAAHPPGIGINAFASPSHSYPDALRLHLVNYDVPRGTDRADPPRVVRNLVATVPLQPKWRVTSVEAFSPHAGENLAIVFELCAGVVSVRVTRLEVYQIIRRPGRAEP